MNAVVVICIVILGYFVYDDAKIIKKLKEKNKQYEECIEDYRYSTKHYDAPIMGYGVCQMFPEMSICSCNSEDL